MAEVLPLNALHYDLDPTDRDTDLPGLDRNTGRANCLQDPAGIRVPAKRGRLNEWRINNGTGDLPRVPLARSAFHVDDQHVVPALRVGRQLTHERAPDLTHRERERFPRI